MPIRQTAGRQQGPRRPRPLWPPEKHAPRTGRGVPVLREHLRHVRHGGHAAAAGFTVHNENLPELVERLKDIAYSQLAEVDLRPTLKADLEIPLVDLKPTILNSLEGIEPTGQENPRAVFVSRGLNVRRANRIGRDGSHLRLDVSDGQITYGAIAFQQGHWMEDMPQYIDLMYHFELNEYNGRSALQLNVIDLKPSGVSDD